MIKFIATCWRKLFSAVKCGGDHTWALMNQRDGFAIFGVVVAEKRKSYWFCKKCGLREDGGFDK